jgi:hypothetical protein
MDKTSFLLNLIVEGTGSYIHWMPYMTLATDAFAQLLVGEGSDPNNLGAYSAWMNDWTIFYMAWWTAWSAFVGLFIARISRGRTLGSVVTFTLVGPFAYIVLWFSVFGGAGIREARVAAELIALGTAQGDAAKYLDADSINCYTAPDAISYTISGVTTNWEYNMKGVNPNCILDVGDSDSAWFNLLNSYYGCGNFLSGLSLVSINMCICIYIDAHIYTLHIHTPTPILLHPHTYSHIHTHIHAGGHRYLLHHLLRLRQPGRGPAGLQRPLRPPLDAESHLGGRGGQCGHGPDRLRGH